LHVVSGDGSWQLLAHEKALVDAVIGTLPTNVQLLVRMQLEQDFFVERTNRRVGVIRPYNADEALRIPDPPFADCLVNVRVSVDGKPQTEHVTFYKGYIFSIELRKPSKFYEGKNIAIVDVKLGKPSQTYTTAIDRVEHGKNEDDAD
jgi:hypothetical protein